MVKDRRSRHSFHCDNERDVHFRSRFSQLRRPYSLVNLVSKNKRVSSEIYESTFIDDEPATSADNSLSLVAVVPRVEENAKKDKECKTIVSIMLVEARGLPQPPEDGSNHTLYSKIRLGDETIKSKAVQTNRHVEWRERMKLQLHKDHLLRISLWDKGKQKNFMGSCVLDLSRLERERTHEIWQQLDDGYGSIHLFVTMCSITNGDETTTIQQEIHFNENHTFHKLNTNWKVVGELHVKVIAARGLSGKPNAYCILELDNERIQTPNARGLELTWNKSYVFNVYDISSILNIKICNEESLVNLVFSDTLGNISIPLLRICNGEERWYALKNKSKKNIAKGNCPRVLLKLSVFWNPVKASVRLFQPKEVKHTKKAPIYDISLVYKNLEFVRDTFLFLVKINDAYKRTFEWDNQELSAMALLAWLLFWCYFKLWTIPLVLLIPFMFYWVSNRKYQEKTFMRNYSSTSFNTNGTDHNENEKDQSKSVKGKINDMVDTTIIVTTGVDYLASVAERLYNLVSFKMPFLSFLTMIILLGASGVLYVVPFNYIMMALGIYKFTRKRLNPERVPNNDILDFISRLPDNEDLKEWREFSVPEPNQRLSAF